jgi:predicted MFS family arabinose efflux permease
MTMPVPAPGPAPAPTDTGLSVGRRLADASTMFFVSLLSILLLIFIAEGTSKRTYEQLLIDKSAAQGELVRNSIEAYVRPGLPLRQFTGFNQQTSSIITGDQTLVSMLVELPDGELVFSTGDTTVRRLAPSGTATAIHNDGEVRRSDDLIQIILPLKNKFERVGFLVLNMDRQAIYRDVAGKAVTNLMVGLALCAAFGLSVFSSSRYRAGGDRRVIALTFTACFAAVALTIILSMISLFTTGAESKGRALVSSLGQRFDDIPQLSLQLDQIEGLDDVLDSYRRLNPEISTITITVNGRIAVHTDRARVGALWASDPEQSEYRAMLTAPNHPRAAHVILSVPRNFVLWQVARNIKNYAALFVASALFAALFLQVAHAIQTARPVEGTEASDWRSDLALDLVKPIFFLAVFVDHLSYAFLPQFMTALKASSGDTVAGAAWPFTAYYLCFALALIPAGHYCARIGSRNLIVSGLAMVAIGLAAMALVQTLGAAVLARAIGGFGQGLLFIGVQSHILANARRDNRTRSNSIVVYGFQAGMISGMAIGSLLVGEIAAVGVFIVGACIATLASIYASIFLPAGRAASGTEAEQSVLFALNNSINMLRDLQFAQAILLIGIPAKAIMTGVILFGMPLLLSASGFAKEDIGQITMIYAACVMLASTAASRLADKMQTCKTMLVTGSLLTAAGLSVIALIGQDLTNLGAHAHLTKALLFALGAALIGCAHGLINAPIVTFITETAAAARTSEASAAASYRFLERCGHMLGPILVGQLFAVLGTTPHAFGWLAVGMIILGAIFHLFNHAEAKSDKREFA